MERYVLITERSAGPRDSRVLQTTIRLRNGVDAVRISKALASGALRVRPGVTAWVDMLGGGR